MNEDRLEPQGSLGTGLIQAPTGAGEFGLQAESQASALDLGVSQVSQNPAEILASLMDFPGSVALAELLDEPLPRTTAPAYAVELGERLLDDVRARLDALEPMALKPLLGRRGPSLLAPHEYLAVLKRHGFGVPKPEPEVAEAEPEPETKPAASSRSGARTAPPPAPAPAPNPLPALLDELSGPFASALGTSLRQAQAHIATLRWEIAHDIRALGPTADRLERIDAALTRAMQGKMGELLDRMEYAAQLTFDRAFQHAVSELPSDFGEADLAEWSEESGWLGRYRERCVRMTKALFGHQRRSLEGLLRAATHAGNTLDSTTQEGDEP
jgi:hypothetical protein